MLILLMEGTIPPSTFMQLIPNHFQGILTKGCGTICTVVEGKGKTTINNKVFMEQRRCL